MVGISYISRLKKLLETAKGDDQLFHNIVNAPFSDVVRATQLDLGIVVLLLVNKKSKTIDRVALSDTEQAAGAIKMSEKPFKEIRIPLGYGDNLIAQAIDSGEYQCVSDWKHLFTPALSPRAARFNQAGAGIEFSCIYPLRARDGGAIIFSFFQESKNINNIHYRFMDSYTNLVDRSLGG